VRLCLGRLDAGIPSWFRGTIRFDVVVLCRKLYCERRAPAFRARGVDSSAMRLDDLAYYRQPETESLRLFGPASSAWLNASKRNGRNVSGIPSPVSLTMMCTLEDAPRIFRKNPKDESVISRGAEVIERNAAIQLQLIEELLDISRISAGKLELALESIEIHNLVNDALETLEPMALAKGIVFNRVLPKESRIAVVDGKRFQQIVWNLVSNAIKFTPRCGSINACLK
jgi:signal transduction histidine kinase